MPPKIKATAVNAVIGAVYHDQVFGLGGVEEINYMDRRYSLWFIYRDTLLHKNL